ncbi:MAG: TetR/AcrR family transcriptional regulator [Alphaproteobacteria bacterium]|nr:TetR/AcrR family transcriptional regulator [Alphaproteobacteria bacterium]
MSSDAPETRTRILQTTLNLLEGGTERGVRMADIAKQAGITRQALYLHFSTRAELLIAATRHLDDLKAANDRLMPSRKAKSGVERLNAYIAAWTAYLPEIYGTAKALLAMKDTDQAAAIAWNERMQDMKEGCEAAINALSADKRLLPDYTPDQATDILWTMLSVRNWEQLTLECGWSQEKYTNTISRMAHRLLVSDEARVEGNART